MQIIMILYVVALFVALTPGVLLKLPAGGSKLTIAVVHGLVFAAVYCLTKELVSRTFYAEGFNRFNLNLGGVASRSALVTPTPTYSSVSARYLPSLLR